MENEIHIRSLTDDKYLTATGTWSALVMNARVFPGTTEARDWCHQEKLKDVELVAPRVGQPPLCFRVYRSFG